MSTRVAVVGSNFGRGVDVSVFKDNVLAILKELERRRKVDVVVWLPTEMDEADKPLEHEEFINLVAPALDGHETLVGWHTFEPIIVSDGCEVIDESVVTACHGLAGLTPDRHFVEATVKFEDGAEVLFRNHHPPINRYATRSRRSECRRKHKARTNKTFKAGLTQMDSGDYNDAKYPVMHVHQKTLLRQHYDYIRSLTPRRGGAKIELVNKQIIPGHIDNHNDLLVVVDVSKASGLR
jgi:hypothetical protein